MELSKLHPHSLGVVTNNPPVGSKEIAVQLLEHRFGQSEELVDSPVKMEFSFKTAAGEEAGTIVENNSVTAIWLRRNTNRTTPPNVRRGDQVIVWKLGNNKYFWEDRHTVDVKRLETVIYAFSADPNNGLKDDLSNAYFLEISSHTKAITLGTSKANGEPFAYTIQLDLEYGKYTATDDVGNMVYIDSPKTEVALRNRDDSEFRLTKEDIFGKANKLIEFKCKDFHVICTNFKIQCDSYVASSKNSYKVSSKSYAVDASSYSISASDCGISAGSIGLKGDVGVTGSLKVNGRSVRLN